MAYIGNPPANRFVAPKAASVFSGDGSTTAFTLDHAVGSDEDILVSVDGVIQEPSVAYAVSSGTTLTFTAAPSSNSGNNIFVYYLFRTVGTVSHPSNNALSATTGTFTGAFTSLGIDDNADATAITIDSSEKVGIGQTTPVRRLHIKDTSADMYIGLEGGTSNTVGILLGDTDNHTQSRIQHYNSDNSFRFSTAETERMRIDTNGNIMFNSSVYSTADARLVTSHDGNAQVGFTIRSTSSVAQSEKQIQFKKDNTSGVTEVGTITSNRTSTAYNTSSDYRLKENVTYDFDATTRLKQLKPARFNFKVDADTTVDGFLAHEVQTIVPEAVSGEKDAVDVDGNIDPQGIDQSKLVPLLVKTIQELEARITVLENK